MLRPAAPATDDGRDGTVRPAAGRRGLERGAPRGDTGHPAPRNEAREQIPEEPVTILAARNDDDGVASGLLCSSLLRRTERGRTLDRAWPLPGATDIVAEAGARLPAQVRSPAQPRREPKTATPAPASRPVT
ncbi:hypothetical protein GCM10022630_32780 [Thermobifida alba]